jgi:hypothetical protein
MKRLKVEVEFAVVPIWLLTADISAQAVRVYAILSRLAYKTRTPHPSYKELAETARCSLATARRAVAELAEIEAVKVEHRVDGRGQDANGYLVMVSRPLLIGEQAGLFMDEQAPRSQVSTPKEKEEVQDKKPLATKAKQDPIWDGFVAWLAREPETETERGAWNKAAKQLRDIEVDSVDEVVRRGLLYGRRYPEAARTPNALVAHWSEFSTGNPMFPRRQSKRVSEMSDEELEALSG